MVKISRKEGSRGRWREKEREFIDIKRLKNDFELEKIK